MREHSFKLYGNKILDSITLETFMVDSETVHFTRRTSLRQFVIT
jgi:hypothetical protein